MQDTWPPADPSRRQIDYGDDETPARLPNTPWTYGANSFNPALRPSNQAIRRQYPPYHPMYGQEQPVESDEDSDSESGRAIVRRGSEGYEVRQIDREEVLRTYIETRGEDALRYRRYVPEQTSDGEESLLQDEQDPSLVAETVPSAVTTATSYSEKGVGPI